MKTKEQATMMTFLGAWKDLYDKGTKDDRVVNKKNKKERKIKCYL